MYDCRQFFIDGAWVPPGGRKESLVNGREWRREGFKEFLETKAVMGYFT